MDVATMSNQTSNTVNLSSPMNAAELLALKDEKDFELANGQLVALHSGFQAAHVGVQLAGQLFIFNQTHRLGWVLGARCGYQLPLPGHDTVRKPDASFISFQRLPIPEKLPTGYPVVAPDLAAEVVAPDDLAYELETKINDYLLAGVRLIWVINPVGQSVLIYRQDGTFDRRLETDELDGEDVLPGFRCSIASLLEVPQQAS